MMINNGEAKSFHSKIGVILVFALGCLNISCGSPERIHLNNPGPKGGTNEGTDLEFETLNYHSFGSGVPFNIVIQDQESWDGLATFDVASMQFTVNFEKETVIGVGIGTRSSGGYTVTIMSIVENAGTILISYEEETPGYGCPVTMSLTSPYHYVRTQKLDQPIDFKLTKVKGTPCQPPAPATACEIAKETIEKELDAIRACHEKTDCTVNTQSQCPFGCFQLHNKNVSLDTLDKLIDDYGKANECGLCDYACLPPPSESDLDCIGGWCEIVTSQF